MLNNHSYNYLLHLHDLYDFLFPLRCLLLYPASNPLNPAILRRFCVKRKVKTNLITYDILTRGISMILVDYILYVRVFNYQFHCSHGHDHHDDCRAARIHQRLRMIHQWLGTDE